MQAGGDPHERDFRSLPDSYGLMYYMRNKVDITPSLSWQPHLPTPQSKPNRTGQAPGKQLPRFPLQLTCRSDKSARRVNNI